jgi:hypothetical protein
MAVAKRKAKSTIGARPKRFTRGRKNQITLALPPDILDRVDALVSKKRISRAALLTLWIVEALDKEAA